MENNKNALVIGATGLLGYGVTLELYRHGWNVRAVGKEELFCSNMFPHEVEYICGDFYDETFIHNCLKGIDKVFFFLSSTFPSTSSDSLELEISRTLYGLDYLIRKMRDANVHYLVFPSSGGTIYGDIEYGLVKETDMLNPLTPYGVGKMMCENIISFYTKFDINSTILRVGNVYGSTLARTASQGVIDVFVQKAITNETATVWGDSISNIRDYIFLDDFSEAVAIISDFNFDGVEVFNLGSSIGTSLEDIITSINKHSPQPLNLKYVQNDATSLIKRIVLDMSKFYNITGWKPKYSIDSGISETFERKLHSRMFN